MWMSFRNIRLCMSALDAARFGMPKRDLLVIVSTDLESDICIPSPPQVLLRLVHIYLEQHTNSNTAFIRFLVSPISLPGNAFRGIRMRPWRSPTKMLFFMHKRCAVLFAETVSCHMFRLQTTGTNLLIK